MMNTGLRGPFPLTLESIGLAAATAAESGVYALGYVDAKARFCVTFVGTALGDMQSALRGHIGTAQCFKLELYASPEKAFIKACELFHDFRPAGNFLHPDRPRDAAWRCPRCSPRAS
jgi:hypothetical protein